MQFSRARGLLAVFCAAILLAVSVHLDAVTASSRERTISLYNIHTKETVTVVFKRDGKYVDTGLEQVNYILRDWRRNETTRMDPALVDLLWEIHEELGSKEPIHVISGYRSRATNENLRRTVGGQASESRHVYGKAADVQFPDVPLKNLRYSALIREKGGVGYYPTSAIPFVHVDTDRVRAWPRLPRPELALLFPKGVTQHMPADGGPLTKDDVRAARAANPELAAQIAVFNDQRAHARGAVAFAQAGDRQARGNQVAALQPAIGESSLTFGSPPKSGSRITAVPADDRARLSDLAAQASITPQLLFGPRPARRSGTTLASLSGDVLPSPPVLNPREAARAPTRQASQDLARSGGIDRLLETERATWTRAPAYDDEHPDELSYRPFPIAPFLTATASEPLMSELVHHDVARTLELLDQPGSVLPLRFRPQEPAARLLWSQQFTGEAVALSKLRELQEPTTTALQNRPVRTTQR